MMASMVGGPKLGMRVILFVVYFALLVNSWRRWVNQNYKDKSRPGPTRTLRDWPLSPSNLAILVGALFYVYWCFHFRDPAPAPRLSFWLSVLIVGLAFAVRRWEDEATRE